MGKGSPLLAHLDRKPKKQKPQKPRIIRRMLGFHSLRSPPSFFTIFTPNSFLSSKAPSSLQWRQRLETLGRPETPILSGASANTPDPRCTTSVVSGPSRPKTAASSLATTPSRPPRLRRRSRRSSTPLTMSRNPSSTSGSPSLPSSGPSLSIYAYIFF